MTIYAHRLLFAKAQDFLKQHRFWQQTQSSKTLILTLRKTKNAQNLKYGDSGRARTCDLPLRRRLLYPAELRGLAGAAHPNGLPTRSELLTPNGAEEQDIYNNSVGPLADAAGTEIV